jgi:phycobilisome core-membrane linker protein
VQDPQNRRHSRIELAATVGELPAKPLPPRADRPLLQRHPLLSPDTRQEIPVFKLTSLANKAEVNNLIRAAYRQVFERDMDIYNISAELSSAESKLRNGEITVKEFIEALGCSELYRSEFYAPYPNTKVIELGTKHFLGRAPLNQQEIRKYNQILATQGVKAFVRALLNTQEYRDLFGEDTVPYRRFPTLPAANFPNTQELYGRLTKQNRELVVPSFSPVGNDRS